MGPPGETGSDGNDVRFENDDFIVEVDFSSCMHCYRVSLDCLVNLELRVNQVIKVLLATLEEMDRMEREVQKVI